MSEMQQRTGDCLKRGVTYVWVLDPVLRQPSVVAAEGSAGAKDGGLRTRNPDIAVPPAGISAAL